MTTSPPPSNAGHDHPAPAPVGVPGDPSPTAELTTLAAQLYQLADRVNRLDARTGELCTTITDDVLPQLVALRTTTADQLAEHTAHVQQLIDAATEHTRAPVGWATMDADQAATEWEALASWIEHTLVPWYDLTRDQLPDCWALHRPAVIELAWLHHTHQAAHRPGAAPHLVAEWHTRWKPAVLRTVHDAIPRRGPRVCGPERHLVSEADRVHRPPSEPPARIPTQPAAAPTARAAERHHWQHSYQLAVAADLAMRHKRLGPAS